MTISSNVPKSEPLQAFTRLGLLVLCLGLASPCILAAQSSNLDRAGAMLESGQVEEALQPAEAAVRRSPRNPKAHLVFGSVLLALGRTGEAAKSFEFALALDSGLRAEVGRAFMVAALRLSGSNPDGAEDFLSRAVQYDPTLQQEGAEAVIKDALARVRAGAEGGQELLTRWLSRYPGYRPSGEEDLFFLAGYYEAEGKLSEAADLYARCAQEFPDGALGRRAAEHLQPRLVKVDRLLSAPCSEKLFIGLRSLELGFDFTRAELSFVWVSENRAASHSKTLRLLPDSHLATADGQIHTVTSRRGPTGIIDRDIQLGTDAERRVTLDFPPVPRGQATASLVLMNDSCGTSGNWRRHSFRFNDLPLISSQAAAESGAGSGPGTSPHESVDVIHFHDYFLAAGRCSGTLSFFADRISYSSGPHSFELPCEDVLQIGRDSKEVTTDLLGRVGEIGTVPTMVIEGRVVNKKGKLKTETWHFLAQDDTPPVLLLSKNLCRQGR